MKDERNQKEAAFPSGPWVGIYNHYDRGPRHRMTLELTFLEGRTRGTGTDEDGFFSVAGTYDPARQECVLHKVRPGQAEIALTGYLEHGAIWGTWTASGVHGGFQIWPRNLAPADLAENLSVDAR